MNYFVLLMASNSIIYAKLNEKGIYENGRINKLLWKRLRDGKMFRIRFKLSIVVLNMLAYVECMKSNCMYDIFVI